MGCWGGPSNIPEDTYAFEKKGWSGYSFEPLPEMENLWLKNKKADFYPYTILDEDKELVFSIRQKGKAWENSLSNIFGKNVHSDSEVMEFENFKVQGIALKGFFYKKNIKHINYMSVVVEGSELLALKGIECNFTRVDPLTL